MKKFLLFLLTVYLYAGSAGLEIVNKLDFTVVIDDSYGGVIYVHNKEWRGRQVHLFPGESVTYTIQCGKQVRFVAMPEKDFKFYKLEFTPKCGGSYTWNITYQDEWK